MLECGHGQGLINGANEQSEECAPATELSLWSVWPVSLLNSVEGCTGALPNILNLLRAEENGTLGKGCAVFHSLSRRLLLKPAGTWTLDCFGLKSQREVAWLAGSLRVPF